MLQQKLFHFRKYASSHVTGTVENKIYAKIHNETNSRGLPLLESCVHDRRIPEGNRYEINKNHLESFGISRKIWESRRIARNLCTLQTGVVAPSSSELKIQANRTLTPLRIACLYVTDNLKQP